MLIPEPSRATFARYFANWSIELPDELPEGEPCSIANDRGWGIRVRLDQVDDQPVIEGCASHRMTNSRYFRIAADGETLEYTGLSDLLGVFDDSDSALRRTLRQRGLL